MAQTDDRDVISQNRAFDLLSNARRRFVLSYLSQQDRPVELRELADEVARWETGSETLSRKERKRVYVSLYQTHIPRLADAGVIEYDSDSGLVQLVDRARDINQYIGGARNEPNWPLYHLAASVFGTLFYVLALFGVIPFVSADIGGLLVLGLLVGVSSVHLLYTKRQRAIRFQSDQFVTDSNE